MSMNKDECPQLQQVVAVSGSFRWIMAIIIYLPQMYHAERNAIKKNSSFASKSNFQSQCKLKNEFPKGMR